MEKNLAFETIGSSARRTQRPVNPDRIATDVSFELEKSEGVRPSVAFMPHRFSPSIKRIHTVSNEDFGIAVPKGHIVSAVPVVSKGAYDEGFLAPVSGTTIIRPGIISGEHAVGIDNDNNVIYASTDNPLFGYGKVINAAVIANGGRDVADNYSQYDVDTERLTPAGTIVSLSDSFLRGMNIPLGIAMEDIYINREGQYLNASETSFQLFDAILSDWLIAVPYIVNGGTYTPAITCAVSGGAQTQSDAYAAIYDKGIACLIAANKDDVFTLGNYVKSDYNGKFVPQFTNSNLESDYSEGDESTYMGDSYNPDCQTVGRIFAVDTKFPKDLEDIVQTYPYNRSGGTATYGLPLELYRLIYFVMASISSTELTYTTIMEYINSGEAGIVWINLHTN